MLSNRIPHVSQRNIYESTDDEQIHHLSNINPVPLHLMDSQHPTSHQYSSGIKASGGENEFVDINDMNFMEHRREIDHENLLVRRSQRKIKKDEECKLKWSGSLLRRLIFFFIRFVAVVISDKQVPFRSLCSLPTAYLYINGNGDNGEFKSFSAKIEVQFFRLKLISRRQSLREKGNSIENKIWTGRR